MNAPELTEEQRMMRQSLAHLVLDERIFSKIGPAVNSGPDSPVGPGSPTDIKVAPGHLIRIAWSSSGPPVPAPRSSSTRRSTRA